MLMAALSEWQTVKTRTMPVRRAAIVLSRLWAWPWVMELWCACAWSIRNRLHTAVGVALGNGVVVRMRLGNKKQVTLSCGRGPE